MIDLFHILCLFAVITIQIKVTRKKSFWRVAGAPDRKLQLQKFLTEHVIFWFAYVCIALSYIMFKNRGF